MIRVKLELPPCGSETADWCFSLLDMGKGRATAPLERTNTARDKASRTYRKLLAYLLTTLLLGGDVQLNPSSRICSLQSGYSRAKVILMNRDIHPETRQSKIPSTLASSKLSNIPKSFGIHTQNRKVFLGNIWTFVALKQKPNNLKHFTWTQIWTSCVYLKHGWPHRRL